MPRGRQYNLECSFEGCKIRLARGEWRRHFIMVFFVVVSFLFHQFVSWLQFKDKAERRGEERRAPFRGRAERDENFRYFSFLSDVKGDNWAKQKREIYIPRRRRTFISVSVRRPSVHFHFFSFSLPLSLVSIKRAKWSAITIMFVILPVGGRERGAVQEKRTNERRHSLQRRIEGWKPAGQFYSTTRRRMNRWTTEEWSNSRWGTTSMSDDPFGPQPFRNYVTLSVAVDSTVHSKNVSVHYVNILNMGFCLEAKVDF